MARPRKKPAPSVAVLEHLPAMREALASLGLELIVRPAGATHAAGRGGLNDRNTVVGPGYKVGQAEHSEAAASVSPGWSDGWMDPEVATAVDEEMGIAKPKPSKPLAQLPAAQRKAIADGFLADIQAERQANAMSKDASAPVTTESIETLSEAT